VLITLVSHATQGAITIEALWCASADATKALLAFGVAASACDDKVGGLRPEGLACTCGRRDDPTTDNAAQWRMSSLLPFILGDDIRGLC
jgi:hypothetical protein